MLLPYVNQHLIGNDEIWQSCSNKDQKQEQQNLKEIYIYKLSFIGSLILIHGLVPHGSKANTSEHSRHAYTFHVLDRHNSVWSKDNW